MMRPPFTSDELDTADDAIREQVLREFERIRAENDALMTLRRLTDAVWPDDEGK